jgi:murein DD-endopeptidase MepM/ murein hydrolase activator NlpD
MKKVLHIFLPSLLFLMSLPILAKYIIVTTVCKDYVITSSDGGYFTGTVCWEEYISTGGDGGGSSGGGFDGGGSGEPGSGDDGDSYLGTPIDEDGNGILDCWKDVVENGDYNLDSGDDFGPRTLNGENDYHYGIDIQATRGTVIYSPIHGQVINTAQSTSENQYNGAYVRARVAASDGIYEFVMIHMVTDSVIVEVGDTLSPGQPIGQVNCTGACGGDHLHLQVYEVTYPIDQITRKPK